MRSLQYDQLLPKGWYLARFDEFLKRIERKIILDDSAAYECVGVRWYGNGAFVRERLLGLDISRKQQWLIQTGDIVYNKLFAWKGSFAIADDTVNGCIVSDKFPTYKANLTKIDPNFLRYYFRTLDLAQQALDLSKGGAAISKLTLNPPQFWDLTIPLPPLEEQQRIVARIEELAARIEEARGLRREAVEKAEAIVHSTFRRILTCETDNPNWELGPIPLFAQINPSRQRQIIYSPNLQVSFVPMSAVDDETGFIVSPEVRTYEEVSKGHTMFQDGDVIFARITPCMQNGKAAYVQGLINGVGFGSTEFHVLRPGPKIMGEWLHLLLRHKDFRDDAMLHFKGTAGQQRVPKSFLEQKVIHVPPLSVQQGIISYIEDMQAKIYVVKQLQSETSAELDALLPTVLDKAFKGEL